MDTIMIYTRVYTNTNNNHTVSIDCNISYKPQTSRSCPSRAILQLHGAHISTVLSSMCLSRHATSSEAPVHIESFQFCACLGP